MCCGLDRVLVRPGLGSNDPRAEMDRLAELFLGSAPRHQAATPSDLEELQRTARLLRSELDRVIEDKVAGDQTCEAVDGNIERLRALATEKKLRRDELSKESNDAEADSHDVKDACHSEEQKLHGLHQHIQHLRDERQRVSAAVVDARNTTARVKHTIETAFPETTCFRLRADVQNLQTEQEIGQIKSRGINNQRKVVHNNLDTKRQQREEIQSRAEELHKQIEEEKTRNELLHTRNQFLTDQLQRIGGRAPHDNVISSVQNLFTKMTTKRNHRDSTIMKPNSLRNSSCESNHQSPTPSLNNISNSQQKAQNSILTDQLLYRPPLLLHQMDVAPDEIQPENNVYKFGQRRGISIFCKDDDDNSIVSALTVDETEFENHGNRVTEKQD